MNAACIFGERLRAPPPPPKKKFRRGVVLVPVPVPVPPPPALPPGGGPLPGGREGRVTPCDFRHATSFVRCALPAAPPPAADDDPDDEADAVEVLVELLELLALPQAAIRQPAARVTTATAIRPDLM
ncbi:MAG TPA: hypothetical protein VGF91_23690 [Solirubrobacteraceae bacterium]